MPQTKLAYLRDRFLTTLESIYYHIVNFFKKPRDLKPDDILSAFIKDRKHYDKKTKKITYVPFMPESYKARLETSVFCTTNLRENKIWKMAHRWTVINPWPRRSGKNPVKGMGSIPNYNIHPISPLFTSIDPSPHPKHGVILGWGNNEEEQKIAALSLSNLANTIMKE